MDDEDVFYSFTFYLNSTRMELLQRHLSQMVTDTTDVIFDDVTVTQLGWPQIIDDSQADGRSQAPSERYQRIRKYFHTTHKSTHQRNYLKKHDE